MKKTLLILIAIIFGHITLAQVGTIENINVAQRTDGTGKVDIRFDLTGVATARYNISLEASFDSGETYQPIGNQYLSGNLADVSPTDSISIVWDGLGSHPDVFSEEARLKIEATLVGDNNGDENSDTGTTTDIDGNVYQTVIIGNQLWMAENLKTTRYKDNSSIPTGHLNPEWFSLKMGAYSVYPHGEIEGINSDNEVLQAFGALYNWNAVADPRGLCPNGWRVATDLDWEILVDYVVDQGYPNNNDSNGAGNALKSCRQVNNSSSGECNTSEFPRWDSDSIHNSLDRFGFSALPGGTRHHWGNNGVGNIGYWWTSTSDSPYNAWSRAMLSSQSTVGRINYGKGNGFSVRCIKE